jgi:hypothetical protein
VNFPTDATVLCFWNVIIAQTRLLKMPGRMPCCDDPGLSDDALMLSISRQAGDGPIVSLVLAMLATVTPSSSFFLLFPSSF